MSVAVNLFVGIIVLAGVYAIANVGFVLLYKGTGVPNFAQGGLLMLGAYVMSTSGLVGHSYWPALVLTCVVMGIVGALIYVFIMRWLLGAVEFEKVVLTFVVASAITQIIELIWGTSSRAVPVSSNHQFLLLGGHVAVQGIESTVVILVVIVGLMTVLSRTLLGLRMRALAENESLAVYRGIRVHRLSAIAWVIASVCAAVAGVTYAEVSSVSLSMADIGLLAFPAAVLGGLDSIGGTIIGALIIAAVLNLSQYYLGGVWGVVVEYAAMLLVLMVLPFGLFGSRSTRRL
jgi:branched-chain amino acid transport system permease protein